MSDALETAVVAGATAVHFTRSSDGLLVRARIDGSLTELELLSGTEADAAEATLAELNAAARITVVAGEQYVRASPYDVDHDRRATDDLPGRHRGNRPATALDDIVPQDVAGPLREALARPNGLIVFCGLAPAGRATALRTTMLELATQQRVVLSVENPVEILLPSVEQTEVDALAGLTLPRRATGGPPLGPRCRGGRRAGRLRDCPARRARRAGSTRSRHPRSTRLRVGGPAPARPRRHPERARRHGHRHRPGSGPSPAARRAASRTTRPTTSWSSSACPRTSEADGSSAAVEAAPRAMRPVIAAGSTSSRRFPCRTRCVSSWLAGPRAKRSSEPRSRPGCEHCARGQCGSASTA